MVNDQSKNTEIVDKTEVVNPKCNQLGIDLIKLSENFKSKPYYCTSGYLTIGYGHVILKHESYKSVTKEEAEEILKKDIVIAENIIKKQIDVDLNSNQFSALVSFAFNIGSGQFQASTLRRVLNDGQYNEVPAQLKRWIFSKGKIPAGLPIRRDRECELWLA